MAAISAFGQDQPPVPSPPPHGGDSPMMPGMQGQGMMQWMRRPGSMQGMQRQRMMPGMVGPAGMQGMPEMRPGDPAARLLRDPEVRKELGITPEQFRKLDEIRFNSEKEAIQHRAALQIHRLELGRLIESETPDRASIDKKIQEVAQEEAALMRSSIDSRLNARSVLTPEQRTKLAQLRQDRMRMARPGAEGAARPARKAGPAREKTPPPAPSAKP